MYFSDKKRYKDLLSENDGCRDNDLVVSICSSCRWRSCVVCGTVCPPHCVCLWWQV